MKREAANDAWVYSVSKGAWSSVTYAPGDVPRVRELDTCPAVNPRTLLTWCDPGECGSTGCSVDSVFSGAASITGGGC